MQESVELVVFFMEGRRYVLLHAVQMLEKKGLNVLLIVEFQCVLSHAIKLDEILYTVPSTVEVHYALLLVGTLEKISHYVLSTVEVQYVPFHAKTLEKISVSALSMVEVHCVLLRVRKTPGRERHYVSFMVIQVNVLLHVKRMQVKAKLYVQSMEGVHYVLPHVREIPENNGRIVLFMEGLRSAHQHA
jgi:hypothetical protein